MPVALSLGPADHRPKQPVLPDTERVSLQDSTQSVYAQEEAQTAFRRTRSKSTNKNALAPERRHTEVNVGETFCVYCISSAFVYGVQAKAGELRLIKKSSLEQKEKPESTTRSHN